MKKILIVDDSAEVRALLSVTLGTGDFEISEASSGQQALDLANFNHPDLIILDIMMPGGMDGYEVCKKIKTNTTTKDITVLLLTAKGQQADRERGLEVGADDYFVKPFSPRELLDKIYGVLKL